MFIQTLWPRKYQCETKLKPFKMTSPHSVMLVVYTELCKEMNFILLMFYAWTLNVFQLNTRGLHCHPANMLNNLWKFSVRLVGVAFPPTFLPSSMLASGL